MSHPDTLENQSSLYDDPRQEPHATRCYVFRLFPKFAAPCFRRKLMCYIKLRLFLSALGWTATLDITLFSNSSCAVIGHVAYSPRNRLFEPVSGRFTPIRPTNPRRQRNGLPTLATVLSPPAPRPTSGVRLCVDPPPLATACHRPPSFPSTPLPAAEAEERWFAARADGDGITSPSPLRDRQLAVATFSTGCSPSWDRTAGKWAPVIRAGYGATYEREAGATVAAGPGPGSRMQPRCSARNDLRGVTSGAGCGVAACHRSVPGHGRGR